jgi:hypothetical protein
MIKKRSKKKQQQKNKLDLTIDMALLFSAIMLIVFTTIMIIAFWNFQSVPDSLIIAFFGAFSLEGGYCAFLHKLKKERQVKMETEKETVIDEPDEGDLVIDLSEEGGE